MAVSPSQRIHPLTAGETTMKQLLALIPLAALPVAAAA